MLLNLHVKNLALIEEADVYFDEGLNILTGETGAGKSIIIGSINIALGGKVPKDIVGKHGDSAFVELIFQIDNSSEKELLRKMEIELEDEQIILSRKITNGRSVAKINGESVPASKLKEVAEVLIDIHGQHDHQSLLHKSKHLEILDEYAKNDIVSIKSKLQHKYASYIELRQKLDKFSVNEEERIRELSFLEYEVEEIQEANLLPDEDKQLEIQYQKMTYGKKILEAANTIYNQTGYDNPHAAGDLIGKALRELNSIVNYDTELESMEEQLETIESLLNDFNRDIADYMSRMEFGEHDFNETEKRLNLINHLKSKYGDSISEIIQSKTQKEERIEELKNHDILLKKYREELETLQEDLQIESEKLTEVRKRYAKKLMLEIQDSLKELNFIDIQFDTVFEKMDHFTKNGNDIMEFMISTNPGEDLKPLAKIASGGEMSRVMLAIKSVLAENDNIQTLIFDEIDTGISGRTAQMVSEKMAVLGKAHQIICITHLPQIAAMADTHFCIEKESLNHMTSTKIKKLEKDQAVKELARILGGAEITETTIRSAKEMKELAERTKKG
ncbi:DNA repair protein RecN [Anaerosacchariphilus polymeriproducens]|uniref:DNA repair protein RecN n=1 Tax=Anaerosacchariphilus polymeriproducens TaxID=1812858 RepID=A0A371AZ76_9FIRM|nr:DNA repair protein RecN [Anaerosacchariphilus polymeriproducens]RDU24861.1 DNA repair protein RecN [Anaerosacchariphilus polymeriproducens]